ncbi:MAG: disulfide bond formation protein B [Patescibacteria group bacterium]
MIQIVSQFISFGIVVLLVATIGLFLLFVARRVRKLPIPLEWILSQISEYFLWLVLFVTASSVVGSLFYSNVVGFEPCSLCWYQRILLYPQALIALLALWYKDRRFAPQYILGLSYIGVVIAVYHTYLQYGGLPLVPCSAATVSCAQRFVFDFGFVTIPMMSLVVFAFIILTIHTSIWYNKKQL